VNAARALAVPLALAMVVGLAACFSAPERRAPAPISTVPPVVSAPPMPVTVPDAVPHIEPRARYGNPPFYDVFGKRYYVLSSSVGYWERGVASWYGPGFHKVRTSIGEPYDMYAMTAAHKTLPLPAYVRVTNLQNGRSVVVRVNDRGPFVGNRIIDLSYTAAAKLDMLRNGTAMVDVRTIDPMTPPVFTASTAPVAPTGAGPAVAAPAAAAPPATALPTAAPAAAALTVVPFADTSPAMPQPPVPQPATAPGATPVQSSATAVQSSAAGASFTRSPLFIQAGAFSDPANAERMAEKLRGGNLGKVFVRDDVIAGRRMYRVRIGPVPDVANFDRVVAALERAGINDAHLALD
jgi:rare lipoprotein A